jgi:hypothetical protein
MESESESESERERERVNSRRAVVLCGGRTAEQRGSRVPLLAAAAVVVLQSNCGGSTSPSDQPTLVLRLFAARGACVRACVRAWGVVAQAKPAESAGP